MIITLVALLCFGTCLTAVEPPSAPLVFERRNPYRRELMEIEERGIPREHLENAIYLMQTYLNRTIETHAFRPAQERMGLFWVFRNELHPTVQLWIAIRVRSIPMIESALCFRSEINTLFQTNNDQYTAVHFAAAYGYTEIVRYFYETHEFFEIDHRTQNQETPLHIAVRHERVDAAQFLLENGADANARNHRRQTPLHIAAQRNSPDIARLLIEHQADINAEDINRRIPAYYASQNTYVDEGFRALFRSASMTPESERDALNHWLFGGGSSEAQ